MNTTPEDPASGEAPFKHEPLAPHYIRLVHLLPSQLPDSSVACYITIHHKDSCPEYEALSYTWGDLNDGTRDILLDGRLFTVRSNLCLFLNNLRREGTVRVIWADAICIDQSNVEERNHQVQSMARIYQSAAKTLVWLVPITQYSDCLLEVISKVDEMVLLRKEYYRKMREIRERLIGQVPESISIDWIAIPQETLESLKHWYDASIASLQSSASSLSLVAEESIPDHGALFQHAGDSILKPGAPRGELLEKGLSTMTYLFNCSSVFTKALCKLTKRPYWTRLWIIQEIVLSRHIEVFCGPGSVSWDTWTSMMDCRKHGYEHAKSITTSTAMVIRHEWCRHHRPSATQVPSTTMLSGLQGLRTILEQFERSVCADIRDKIFGLLGLVENAPLEPDYSKTPIELFSELMAQFSYEIHGKSPETRTVSDLLRIGRLLHRALRLNVEGPGGSVSHDGYGSILEVSGTIVGRILTMEPNVSNQGEAGSALINNWIHSMSVELSTCSHLLQGVQGLQKVLSCHSDESFGCIDYSQFLIYLGESGRANRTLTVIYFPGTKRGTPIKYKSVPVLTDTLCWFVDSHGTIGVSDGHVEEGDLVCNCGGISPTNALILRESRSGPQIVGRAIISFASFKNSSLSPLEERLEIAFDSISLLALVLLPFP